jgi:hypothetical protein
MDRELINAIKERIKAGYQVEQIRAEVLEAGHAADYFSACYEAADKQAREEGGVSHIPSSSFTIKNLFLNSWALATLNLGLLTKVLASLAGLLAGSALLATVFYLVADYSFETDFFPFFGGLVIFSISIFISFIISYVALVRGLLNPGEGVKLSALFKKSLSLFVAVTLVSLYVGVITRVGFILFVIPGLLLSFYLLFSLFSVIDEKSKGLSSLVYSLKLVYGRLLEVFIRIFVNSVVLMVVFFTFYILLALMLLVDEAMIFAATLLLVASFVLAAYWQICFLVVLYRSLQDRTVEPVLIVSEKKILLTFKLAFAVVIAFLSVGVFIMCYLAFSEGHLQRYFEEGNFWETSEGRLDTDIKMSQMEELKFAEQYKIENGTYDGICEQMFLNEFAVCNSNEEAYAVEVPLSKGFYCIDSEGYNEVTRRTVIEGASCSKQAPE